MDEAQIFNRFHEAWSAGDLETVLELTDPEAIARPVHVPLFSQSEYRGRDGMAQWYTEMTEPWERFEAIVEEVHPTPGGLIGFLHLVGHREGAVFDARVASVCEMRDGRISSLVARDIWDVKEELGSNPPLIIRA
jgi:ketosteroid isomerase-like protein